MMDPTLYQVLAGTRGGATRVRLLRALDERPRSRRELATEFDLAYSTVHDHVERLEREGLVRRTGDHGAVYAPSDRARESWTTVEDVLRTREETG
ncbi:MAG: transcriptional regulator, ArsR family [uncultured archaeon A07HB70]|jgi:transcriptional regulator, ArsR family|nr:MAG: transcriptional regulator, ArsR family [uncultured archaeon A07HB70]